MNQQLFLSAAALLPAALMSQETAKKTDKPNIMIIVVDDMGYSDMGCYGGEIETPNLDGLANTGIRFTQFFNGARSCPSRASLLTGCYPHTVGITGMGLSLTKNCVTIAEVLKGAGYNTGMTGKWHLSLTQGIGNREDQMKWLSNQNDFDNRPFAPLETYPCNRGFNQHYGTLWGVANFFNPFSLVHNTTRIESSEISDDFYLTDYTTDKTLDLIDDFSSKEEPFFMYVAYNAPHWPLHAKPEDIAKYKGKYNVGWDVLRTQRYDKMIELGLIDPTEVPVAPNGSNKPWESQTDKSWQAANMEVHAAMVDCVDQGIGKIIDKLKATGQYDNTVIMFMVDNGASSENYTIGDFDRHDRTRTGQTVVHNAAVPGSELTYNYLGEGWAGALNTPFRYWKRQSFHGGIATPMIVHWNGGMPESKKGTITKQPGHFIDIMPTCLDLAGAAYPTTYNGNDIQALPAESESLMPLIEGEGTWNGKRTFFWEHEDGRAVRVGDWKLVKHTNVGSWQLYNLAVDYSETNNLSAEYPDKVREMKALWNDWAKIVGLSVSVETPDTPKELVFYYPFNGNLNDSTKNDYKLTPMNAPAFNEGKFGKSLSLNGINQYLDLNTTGLVNTATTQYTVCAWVYDESTIIPTSGTVENGYYFRDEIILAQKDNAGAGRIVLYSRVENPTGGGNVRYFWNNFAGNKQNSASVGSFQRGKWQHIAVVCDPVNKQVKYYIDGVRDLTVSTQNFEASTGGFRIGAHKNGSQGFWHGKIDELYFFKGLLSGDEIRALRDNSYVDTGESENPDDETDLAFYYPFNGNFKDLSENNYQLTPSTSEPTFEAGKYGQALSLNGNAQYLDLNTTDIFNTATAKFTACAWVYDEDTNPPIQPQDEYLFRDEVILAQKDNAGSGRILLYARLNNKGENGATQFYFQNILGNRFNASREGAFQRGKWQHVAVACDAAEQTVTFYIDGVKDSTIATLPFEACTGGFRIGGHKLNKDYWHGKIDELYMFKRILSTEEIGEIYNNTYFTTTNLQIQSAWNLIYDRNSTSLQCVSPLFPIENITVYSLAGAVLAETRKSNNLSVKNLKQGVYLVRAVDKQGDMFSRKIMID